MLVFHRATVRRRHACRAIRQKSRKRRTAGLGGAAYSEARAGSITADATSRAEPTSGGMSHGKAAQPNPYQCGPRVVRAARPCNGLRSSGRPSRRRVMSTSGRGAGKTAGYGVQSTQYTAPSVQSQERSRALQTCAGGILWSFSLPPVSRNPGFLPVALTWREATHYDSPASRPSGMRARVVRTYPSCEISCDCYDE